MTETRTITLTDEQRRWLSAIVEDRRAWFRADVEMHLLLHEPLACEQAKADVALAEAILDALKGARA